MARRPGPTQHVADILSRMGEDRRGRMMRELENHDEATARHIKSLMFTFEDLARLDGRAAQTLLARVEHDRLALALKAAPKDIVLLFAANMSVRARNILADTIEALGEVRMSDVEAARGEIMTIAEQLAEAGDIVIPDEDERYIT